MPRLPILCLFGVVLAAGFPARGDFTGEVLMLPPLVGWSDVEQPASGTSGLRVLRRDRPVDPASAEQLHIRSTGIGETPAPAPAIEALLAEARAGCREVRTEPLWQTAVDGYEAETLAYACIEPTAPATALPAEAVNLRIVVAKVIAGDFRLYQVTRLWEGRPTGGLPAGAAELRDAWAEFFDAVEVCSTLVEPCTPIARRAPGLDPRFATRTPRTGTETPRAVLAPPVLLPQAEKFGRLTGQAEVCGDDATPLLARLDRIFAWVAEEADGAAAARAAFFRGRSAGLKAQRTTPEPCSAILEVFRVYPTRLPRFAPYLESL